ncbi:uncharacterized protein K452DRAFT_80676 [Aplosporella prunicola CBS 121167]|uniref:Uncharacterized protein n=1 Tax=Aplosporella prunicola CBS 121167 TaxID=1176127 RepID=A0A6A6B628_9PEZI|nr:uncharacterized protein K452DRAFT_80676 [Aplosporella prunicola CBS 121167]KAF2139088.1 hypothetical protein K452DRAFT_80676 [Aplosporella prunicola CBS 121167]
MYTIRNHSAQCKSHAMTATESNHADLCSAGAGPRSFWSLYSQTTPYFKTPYLRKPHSLADPDSICGCADAGPSPGSSECGSGSSACSSRGRDELCSSNSCVLCSSCSCRPCSSTRGELCSSCTWGPPFSCSSEASDPPPPPAAAAPDSDPAPSRLMPRRRSSHALVASAPRPMTPTPTATPDPALAPVLSAGEPCVWSGGDVIVALVVLEAVVKDAVFI